VEPLVTTATIILMISMIHIIDSQIELAIVGSEGSSNKSNFISTVDQLYP